VTMQFALCIVSPGFGEAPSSMLRYCQSLCEQVQRSPPRNAEQVGLRHDGRRPKYVAASHGRKRKTMYSFRAEAKR
jgi:hypothetical protein